MKKDFNVSGMTCSACSIRVEKVVSKLEGVDQVSVNLLTHSMQVTIQSEKQIQEIEEAVHQAGYQAKAIQNPHTTKQKIEENVVSTTQSMKSRMKISIIFLIPLMYISMGGMWGAPLPMFISGHAGAASYALIQFLLALPILIINRSYFINGFKALYHCAPNMDSLIAVGSSAALVYGIFALFRIQYGLGTHNMELVAQYHMDLYFEASATILALITVGKYLESKSKSKTTEAISALLDLAPKQAVVLRDGKEITIPQEEVQLKDRVVVRAGMGIAVDGVIIEGGASIDQSSITGESVPVYKQVHDGVIAGTINKSGYFIMEATRVGENTTFAQIIHLVKQASATKAPIAKLADKIAGLFVPIVMLIALLTFIVWIMMGYGIEMALSSAITVLVISCPCALGLATPVSIMVGTGIGAQNKILIKSGEALETLHNVSTVIVDKTGTLTLGKPVVSDIAVFDYDETTVLNYLYSVEHKSEHPLSLAIIDYAQNKNATLLSVHDFKAREGQGIVGVCEGCMVIIGNQQMFKQNNIDITRHESILNTLAKQGKTPLLIGINQVCVGYICVQDPIKETSKQSIAILKDLHIHVVMLTGDNKLTAQAIADTLGIDEVIAEVLPHEKEEAVRHYQNNNNVVAMVGDGVNDSVALVQADVGIAIGAGSDIAIESADIVLMRSDLMDVSNAITLSKATINNVKQNLFWAFFYNALGIPLAAGLLYIPFHLRLTPDFAALAMSLSSVFVVSNALRLRHFKWHTKDEKIIEREKNMELKVEGMMCQHCVKHVKEAVESVANTSDVVVNLDQKIVRFTMSDDVKQQVCEAIAAAGYTVN